MARINGTDNRDTLTGTLFNDIINGRDGDDRLVGLGGNDRLTLAGTRISDLERDDFLF